MVGSMAMRLSNLTKKNKENQQQQQQAAATSKT